MNMKLFALVLAAVVAGPVCADAGDVAEAVVHEAVEAAFTELERQLIGEYYAPRPAESAVDKKKKSKDLPPGLAKRDELPPGLQMQLEKNGTLPPGLAKRDLPSDLELKLPPPPKGYRRIIVGNDIVLVEIRTDRIADIIYDIVTGGS